MSLNPIHARKLIHIINAWIPLGYLFVFPEKNQAVIFIGCFSLGFFLIDISRRRVNWIRAIFEKWFNFMLKEHELSGNITGATWALFVSVITIFLFPKPIAVLSLFYLFVGDSVAALVGRRFGSIKIFGKTLEGTLAGIIVCLLISLPFSEFSLGVKIIGSVAAMLIELIPWPIDDNFIIPLGSGTILFLLS